MSEAQAESETIINFDEDDPVASVYTASKVEKGANGEPCSWWFEVPKWQVIIKPASKIIRLGGEAPNQGLRPSSRINSTVSNLPSEGISGDLSSRTGINLPGGD